MKIRLLAGFAADTTRHHCPAHGVITNEARRILNHEKVDEMSVDRWLRVEYIDGTSETFSFPKQVDDDYEQIQKLREAMRADRIALEVDGLLHVIPMTAVKRLDLSPAPANLPDFVIRGATER